MTTPKPTTNATRVHPTPARASGSLVCVSVSTPAFVTRAVIPSPPPSVPFALPSGAAMATKKNQNPPKSFEEALAELERILSDIEAGEVGLEESLVKYERGNFLIQHCRSVLNRAEQQIDLLSKAADGGLTVEPLNEDSSET